MKEKDKDQAIEWATIAQSLDLSLDLYRENSAQKKDIPTFFKHLVSDFRSLPLLKAFYPQHASFLQTIANCLEQGSDIFSEIDIFINRLKKDSSNRKKIALWETIRRPYQERGFSESKSPRSGYPFQLLWDICAASLNMPLLLYYYRRCYYRYDRPLISDADYDRMERFVERLPVGNDYDEGVSKRQRQPVGDTSASVLSRYLSSPVGDAPYEKFYKGRHSQPLLSLQNALEESEFRECLNKMARFLFPHLKKKEELEAFWGTGEAFAFWGTEKIDGVCLALHYGDGRLVRALSRGDGQEGEELTQNVAHIGSIPQRIACREALHVVAEVYFLKETFEGLKTEIEGEGRGSSARNAAAGIMRSLPPSKEEEKAQWKEKLSCLEYTLHGWSEETMQVLCCKGAAEMHGVLKGLGFQVSHKKRLCRTPQEAVAFYNHLSTIRHKLPYEVDGVVFSVDDFAVRRRLGETAKAPRWAVAFKFPSEEGLSTVRAIDVQVGRLGALTPVARLKPVVLGGVVVRNVSLHNEDYMAGKAIRVGSEVVVYRSGDVIPQIDRVIHNPSFATVYKFPKYCPECGSLVGKESAAYCCSNEQGCPSQLLGQLEHFVSADAMNIEGMGGRTLKVLFEKGWIRYGVEIFDWAEEQKEKRVDLSIEEGFGEVSVEKLLEATERAKSVGLDRVLYSQGIRNLGKNLSSDIGEFLRTKEQLLVFARQCHEKKGELLETVIGLDGVGVGVRKSLEAFFSSSAVERLKKLSGYLTPKALEKKPGRFAGKLFAFTGALDRMGRREAKGHVESLGGQVSNVSSKTDFVVVGQKPGKKAKQAKDLGISIMTEEEFLKIVGFE